MAADYLPYDMRQGLRAHLESQGFTLYSDYDPDFRPARVPIFGYRGDTADTYEEIFVDIITEESICLDDYFKNRTFRRTKDTQGRPIDDASSACFFQHYFPTAKIYWAIPDYIEKNPDYSSFIEKCNKYNIGLFEVKVANVNGQPSYTVNEISSGIPIRKIRYQEATSLVSKLSGRKLEKHEIESVSKLIEKFSHQDLSYLVFYPEPKYQARDICARESEKNISKSLIQKMSELKNVHFRDILKQLSREYNRSILEDYQIALDVTNELWSLYGIEFPTLHVDYEQVLKLDPKYRDHFLHSFQVFLHGVYIIDQMYGSINHSLFRKDIGGMIEDAWVIASTYHDFNYMVQNFEKWSTGFFEKSLHITENNPAKIDLSKCYVKEDYMFNTKRIMLALNVPGFDKDALDFIYDRILDKRNHGMLSALSLLKYFDCKGRQKLSEEVVTAASKAIALHDWNIWGYFSGLATTTEKEDKFGFRFNKKSLIPNIDINDDPISFLLILTDNLQEQGRKGIKYPNTDAILENLDCNNGIIESVLVFSGQCANDWSKEKIFQFESIDRFLNAGKKFTVSIINRSADRSHQTRI